MRQHTASRERPRGGGEGEERGAALVIVMVFIIGVLALLAYLIPTARMSVVAQGQTERMQVAQFVLQSGVNEATWEVRARKDSQGDGPGALGTAFSTDTTLPTTGNPGNPIQDGSGRTIGYYMAIVDNADPDTEEATLLYVVAGVPDLNVYSGAGAEAREKERVLLAAKIKLETVEYQKDPFGDRNALAFAGSAGAGGNGNFGFQGNSNARLEIDVEGYDKDGDGDSDHYVPAVNISDPIIYEEFLAQVVYDGAYDASDAPLVKEAAKLAAELAGTSRADLSGGSASDMSSGSYHYDETVTNDPSSAQRVNEESLQALIDYWREPLTATASTTITGDDDYSGSDYENKLVVLDSGNHFTGTIEGSGTLLIKGGVTLKDGAEIRWDGDVIIAPTGTSATAVNIQSSQIDIDGNLVLVNDASNGKLSLVIQDSDVDLSDTGDGGGILLLNGSDKGAEFRVDKGADVDAQGVLGLMGNSIDFVVGGGNSSSELDFAGSVIIASPPGTADNKLHKFLVEKNGDAHLTFRNASFESGVTSVESGAQHGTTSPPPPLFYNEPGIKAYQVGYAEVVPGTIWPGTMSTVFAAAKSDTEVDDVGVAGMVLASEDESD